MRIRCMRKELGADNLVVYASTVAKRAYLYLRKAKSDWQIMINTE